MAYYCLEAASPVPSRSRSPMWGYSIYTQESGVEGGRDDEGDLVRDVIRALRSFSKILVKACGGGR